MSSRVTLVVCGLLIVISALMSLLLQPYLPDQMASHWNAEGQVDGYSSQSFGLWFTPVLQVVLLALLIAIPRLDPLRRNVLTFSADYNGFIVVLAGFFSYLHGLTLFYNLGWKFEMVSWMLPGFAALFFYTGILLGKSQPNWFIGIRTPWTLSSPVVWKRTHRWGAILFKCSAGLILLGLLFPKAAMWFLLLPVVFSALTLVVLSYVFYRQEESKVSA